MKKGDCYRTRRYDALGLTAMTICSQSEETVIDRLFVQMTVQTCVHEKAYMPHAGGSVCWYISDPYFSHMHSRQSTLIIGFLAGIGLHRYGIATRKAGIAITIWAVMGG